MKNIPEPPGQKKDTPADIAIVVFFAIFAILVATSIFFVHGERLHH